MMKITTLKNGLRVLRILKPHAKTCVIGFVAQTGLAVEEGCFAEGINYLMQRLYWSGTAKYPSSRQLNLYLESLGGQIHSQVDFENFSLYFEVPYYNQFKAVSLLADVIQNSNFETMDVEGQKRALKDHLFGAKKEDIIGMHGKNFILKNFYTSRPEEFSLHYPLETFNSIRKEDIINYLSHQVQPSTSYLVVAGNIQEDALMDLLEQEWIYWNPRTKRYISANDMRYEDPLNLPMITYRQKGSQYTELEMGFMIENNPLARFIDPETGEFLSSLELKRVQSEYLYEMSKVLILNNILGQGISSRLWTKGVEEEMVFNEIGSEIISYKNSLYLQVSGVTENNLFTFGLECILQVLESLRCTTVSINEISRAKESIRGKLYMDSDDLPTRTFWEVRNFLHTGLSFDIEDLEMQIEKIQAAEIRALALDIFIPARMILYISGTTKESKIVDKLVARHLG
jgi:predicted Zn-dependent peptidase